MNPLIARFRKVLLTACWGTLLFLGPVATTSAAATYVYTGNNFTTIADWPSVAGTYTPSMFISGSMTLGSPLAPNLVNQGLAPLSFSFSDGRNSLSHTSNLGSQSFSVSTNSLGEIINWSLHLQTPLAMDPIRTILSSKNATLVVDQGAISPLAGSADSAEVSHPGTWILVPEPGTAALLLTALMLLTLRKEFRTI